MKLDIIRSFEELRRKIDELELRQQTRVMSIEQERQLVARIAELRRELDVKMQELERDKKLKELLERAKVLKAEADEHHKQLIKYAKLAQQHHESMVECYREADRLRARADAAHQKFLEAQRSADEAHRLFIRHQRDARDFDRVIKGIYRKMYEDRDFRERLEARKKAKEIYERFMEGKKISTCLLYTSPSPRD